tara:strand:- start:126 stop:548 length:423 start_codon:yes stop_codon:yes gene_type:complete
MKEELLRKTVSTGISLLLILSLGYWGSHNLAPDSPVVVIEETTPLKFAVPLAINHIFQKNAVQSIVIENIQLRGVIQSSDEKESVAAISINKQPVQYMNENELIQPGLVLKKIYIDHVIVEENGIAKKIEATELNEIQKL